MTYIELLSGDYQCNTCLHIFHDLMGYGEHDCRQTQHIAALESQLREKDEELARLRADKERLDWLGKTYPYDGLFGPTTIAREILYHACDDAWSCGVNQMGGWFTGSTLREAIDAARTKPTGEGKEKS